MLLKFIYIIVFIIHEIRSDELSDATWRDMTNEIISVPKYCENSKNKNCIVKCCPNDYYVRPAKLICAKADPASRRSIDLANIDVYKIKNTSVIKTGDNIKTAFSIVQNEVLSDLSRSASLFSTCDTIILEDGSMKKVNQCNLHFPKLEFCVDFQPMGHNKGFKFTARVFNRESRDGKSRHDFVIVGLSVSTFFCILVLIVYGLVRELRNLQGLIMMAYLCTFVVTCVIKVAQLIGLNENFLSADVCRHLGAAMYYFLLATFFWLSAMSIEVFRIPRKYSNGPPGVLTPRCQRTFYKYCLYAWLTPALVTLLTVAVDRYKLYTKERFRPPFEACYRIDEQTQLYLHLPIGIITISNTILFIIAAYEIWKIRGRIMNNKELRSSQKYESRFFTCLKIFVLTGSTWILELLPNDLPYAIYIIVNFYNMFVGVVIFYVLVCKKKTIYKLCKRLNINNRYVNSLRPQHQSEISSSTKLTSMSHRRQSEDDDELTAQNGSHSNHPAGDITL